MEKRIVCFGEIMMRLNPEGYLRFTQAARFEASYAGGEANVAVSLANYGMDASYVTKLPDNDLGRAARNTLRQFGVDTRDIVWGGPRLGIYFVEKGASQRASKVIYDRAGSSIALAKRADFDWDKILDGAGWFHFTGITPALGPSYVKALRAPLPHIPLLAVGGITPDNIADYMKVGCVGAGVSGVLTNKDLIASGAWDKIEEVARALVANASA